jgi:hypothetical protein
MENTSSEDIALKDCEETLIGVLSKLLPPDIFKSKVIDESPTISTFSSADLEIGIGDLLQRVFGTRHCGRLFAALSTVSQGCSFQPEEPKYSLKL